MSAKGKSRVSGTFVSNSTIGVDTSKMEIRVMRDAETVGAVAAERVGELIKQIVREKGYARVCFATGTSQIKFLEYLVAKPNVPWNKVIAFHLDEYKGIDEKHPASFRRYIKERVVDRVPLKQIHFMDTDTELSLQKFEQALIAEPIDLACIGIGENGHIAFNDPGVAKFHDFHMVRVVALDSACREQQVNEGWFARIEDVPRHAATLTVPAIMGAKYISCVCPELRKAAAVRDTLEGPIVENCPASVLRQHRQCILWLDHDSASMVKSYQLNLI